MTDKRKEAENAAGANEPLDLALGRFIAETREEVARGEHDGKEVVPEGQLELVPFKGHSIRRVLHDGEWWYSLVDVVAALMGAEGTRKHWSDLKRHLIDVEGFSELSDEIGQLPMRAADGKMRQTDAAPVETIFRIIQSIPSKKAEPFKRWLARVGYERIQEIQDPEIAIKRAILTYQIQGRSDDWIEKRIRSVVVRKELTSEWKRRGIEEGHEFAMLTNVISEEAFGVHTENHKKLKGLKRGHNLRDHMTDLELILTMLGESSTKEIARQRDAQGFLQNHHAARAGGGIAGAARRGIEGQTGQKVVSPSNFLGSKSRAADPEKLTGDVS